MNKRETKKNKRETKAARDVAAEDESAIAEVPTILEAATLEDGQRVFDASMAGAGAQLAFTFG